MYNTYSHSRSMSQQNPFTSHPPSQDDTYEEVTLSNQSPPSFLESSRHKFALTPSDWHSEAKSGQEVEGHGGEGAITPRGSAAVDKMIFE